MLSDEFRDVMLLEIGDIQMVQANVPCLAAHSTTKGYARH